jgi:hypothetical protein
MTTLSLSLATAAQRLGRVDRVWLALAAGLAFGLAAAPEQALASLRFVADSLLSIAPWLLLAVAMAAGAQATGADNLIGRAFKGQGLKAVVVASMFGALSPFCSCGVIPVIAALLAMGVPLAPVMAFWLASPIMDPSMFVLTAGVLGTGFALAKTAAAVGLGLLGGFGVMALQRSGRFEQPLRADVGDGGCAGGKLRRPKPVVWRFWQEPARITSFARGAQANLLFLGKWLTLAFVLESLMLAYVPAELVAQAVGQDGWLPVVGAALVGVPAYLNGYAALPLVGGLIGLGMAPGAALAFLVAGGVTSIPAAIAVFALARLPVFLAYLAFALIGATAAGVAFGLVA